MQARDSDAAADVIWITQLLWQLDLILYPNTSRNNLRTHSFSHSNTAQTSMAALGHMTVALLCMAILAVSTVQAAQGTILPHTPTNVLLSLLDIVDVAGCVP